MKQEPLQICIIDDKLPLEGLSDIDKAKLILGNHLEPLAKQPELWEGEMPLFHLFSLLIQSPLYAKSQIEIKWALLPFVCLSAVQSKEYCPKIIIYDWQYGTNSTVSSAEILKKLLDWLPASFFFIYSSNANEIPIELSNIKSETYSNRFQILRKGDTTYAVKAEEIIYDYIALSIEGNQFIKIAGYDVKFNKSGFLEDSKSILHIDSLLGRDVFIKKLEEAGFELTTDKVMKMFADLKLEIYTDSNNTIYTLYDTPKNQNFFGKLVRVSEYVAIEKMKLKKLGKLLETGTVKI